MASKKSFLIWTAFLTTAALMTGCTAKLPPLALPDDPRLKAPYPEELGKPVLNCRYCSTIRYAPDKKDPTKVRRNKKGEPLVGGWDTSPLILAGDKEAKVRHAIYIEPAPIDKILPTDKQKGAQLLTYSIQESKMMFHIDGLSFLPNSPEDGHNQEDRMILLADSLDEVYMIREKLDEFIEETKAEYTKMKEAERKKAEAERLQNIRMKLAKDIIKRFDDIKKKKALRENYLKRRFSKPLAKPLSKPVAPRIKPQQGHLPKKLLHHAR